MWCLLKAESVVVWQVGEQRQGSIDDMLMTQPLVQLGHVAWMETCKSFQFDVTAVRGEI